MSLKGMSYIERGHIEDPHFSSLSKIPAALDMSAGELVGEEEFKVALSQKGARIREETAHPIAARTISLVNTVCDSIEYRIEQSGYTLKDALHDRAEILSTLGQYRALNRGVFSDPKNVASEQREVLGQLEVRLKEVRTRQGEIYEKLWASDPGKVTHLEERRKVQKLELEIGEPSAETGS